MLFWATPLPYSKSEVWVGDPAKGSDTRRDGSNQVVTGIDLFANVVLHELRHTEQIIENDAVLGALNGQVGTIWASGWSFNLSPDNHWSLGPDGQPGMAQVDDDSDQAMDERSDNSEVGFPGSDDVDLDTNANDVADGQGYDGLGVEVDAGRRETSSEDTYWMLDWGNPGKQHATLRKYSD
jgi:hypothetical protein